VESPPSNEPLLFAIHRIQWSSQFLTTTGFYLGKDKSLAIPANKIYFPSPRSTEVFPKDFPALTLDMQCRFTLTPTAQRKMSLRDRRWSGRPAQNLGDETGRGHVP